MLRYYTAYCTASLLFYRTRRVASALINVIDKYCAANQLFNEEFWECRERLVNSLQITKIKGNKGSFTVIPDSRGNAAAKWNVRT